VANAAFSPPTEAEAVAIFLIKFLLDDGEIFFMHKNYILLIS